MYLYFLQQLYLDRLILANHYNNIIYYIIYTLLGNNATEWANKSLST